MCLAEEAYRERKWGRFPALRKALEDKDIPLTDYGIMSASDNMFDAIARLMDIAVLAVEYQSAIKEKAISVGREEMCCDLHELQEALGQASCFLNVAIGKVRMLYATL